VPNKRDFESLSFHVCLCVPLILNAALSLYNFSHWSLKRLLAEKPDVTFYYFNVWVVIASNNTIQ